MRRGRAHSGLIFPNWKGGSGGGRAGRLAAGAEDVVGPVGQADPRPARALLRRRLQRLQTGARGHTLTSARTRAHAFTPAHTHMRMRKHANTHAHAHTHAHARTHARTRTHTHPHRARTHTQTHVAACVRDNRARAASGARAAPFNSPIRYKTDCKRFRSVSSSLSPARRRPIRRLDTKQAASASAASAFSSFSAASRAPYLQRGAARFAASFGPGPGRRHGDRRPVPEQPRRMRARREGMRTRQAIENSIGWFFKPSKREEERVWIGALWQGSRARRSRPTACVVAAAGGRGGG